MGLGWLMPLQGMNYPMIMGMGPHMTTGKPASDGYHAAMEAGDFRLANMYKVQSLKYNEEMKAKWINEQIEKQNLALSDPRETVTRWIEDNAFANQDDGSCYYSCESVVANFSVPWNICSYNIVWKDTG